MRESNDAGIAPVQANASESPRVTNAEPDVVDREIHVGDDGRIGHGRARHHRDREPEAGPAALRGGDADVALHERDQLSADRETEAGAAVATCGRRVGLGEGLEEPLALVRVHAASRVAHVQADIDGRIVQEDERKVLVGLRQQGLELPKAIRACEPLGYLDTLKLIGEDFDELLVNRVCEQVLTDRVRSPTDRQRLPLLVDVERDERAERERARPGRPRAAVQPVFEGDRVRVRATELEGRRRVLRAGPCHRGVLGDSAVLDARLRVHRAGRRCDHHQPDVE